MFRVHLTSAVLAVVLAAVGFAQGNWQAGAGWLCVFFYAGPDAMLARQKERGA